ncbi:hypothetical protein OAA19_02805 [Rubripirellula sp.]|nr:hypothetical protein [Rubripirellula sp.]MDB4339019.1 hypothetical protein [Rubripirellula sp.]
MAAISSNQRVGHNVAPIYLDDSLSRANHILETTFSKGASEIRKSGSCIQHGSQPSNPNPPTPTPLDPKCNPATPEYRWLVAWAENLKTTAGFLLSIYRNGRNEAAVDTGSPNSVLLRQMNSRIGNGFAKPLNVGRDIKVIAEN